MNEEKRLCEYGCGQEAKFFINKKKWCCSSHHSKCKAIRGKNELKNKQLYRDGVRKKTGVAGENHLCWNRGKTKENDERMRKISETLKSKYADGELKGSFCGKHHSEETKRKLSEKTGGIRKGSGRGKHGWYKGYWCDSSWELAWVIYSLDHGVKFERNHQGFEYEFEGKKHKYYPDFILEDGTYVEIKGWMNDKNRAKINQFPNKISIINSSYIRPMLSYSVEKFGESFINEYDNNPYVNSIKIGLTSKKRIICPICGKSFDTYSGKACKECKNIETRKLWPSKQQLKEDILSLSWYEIGLKYNVSRTTPKTWALKYNLSFSRARHKKQIHLCNKCGKTLSHNSKHGFCKSCYLQSKRDKNLNLKTKILNMKETMSWIEIGDSLGVSWEKARAMSRRKT